MKLFDLFEGNEQAYNWHSEPEQRSMDATRAARLYREREPEGSEAIDARLRAQNDQLAQYAKSGNFWLKQKDTQEHISDVFVGKAAAQAAARELLQQRPELQGNLVITAYGPGEQQGLKEFAPPGSDGGNDGDGFDEATLKRLAAQWWNGDEDPRVEQLLMNTGWEIGQDEGYDNGGVFVVMSGDENGDTYLSWPAEELQGVAEDLSRRGFLRGLGAAALAGAGGTAAAGGYTPGQSNDWKYNMGVKRPGSDEPPAADSEQAAGLFKAQSSASRAAAQEAAAAAEKIRYTNPKFNQEYERLEKFYQQTKSSVLGNKRPYSADPDLARRQHAELMKILIAADTEFAEKTNALINQYGRLKEQGVAEGEGRFAGDTKIDIGGIKLKPLAVGDIVKYFGEKSKILALAKDQGLARISIESGYGGSVRTVKISDLKQLGQGMAEAPGAETLGHNQSTVASNLSSLDLGEGDISQLEKDIAAAPVAPIANMEGDEKIGGRYDADDFDDMVARLKKLAGAGPMQTKYDPARRVYRNVPTAQQPPQQPKK